MTRYRNRIAAALITTLSLTHSMIASPTTSARKFESAPANTDWSKAVVESTIKRFPTADSLKGWGYANALYLYGQYLVYLRTHDKRYLDHLQAWIDLHIDDKGVINRPIDALDYMLPGNLLLILYKETKEEKYRLAAQKIRTVFDT